MGYGGVFLSGMSAIPMGGKGSIIGTPLACDILYKQGKWYASVNSDVPQYRLARASGMQTAASN